MEILAKVSREYECRLPNCLIAGKSKMQLGCFGGRNGSVNQLLCLIFIWSSKCANVFRCFFQSLESEKVLLSWCAVFLIIKIQNSVQFVLCKGSVLIKSHFKVFFCFPFYSNNNHGENCTANVRNMNVPQCRMSSGAQRPIFFPLVACISSWLVLAARLKSHIYFNLSSAKVGSLNV